MSSFLGKDGFAWFYGVVEDRNDPLQLGRLKVRVYGYHHEDKNIMPTDSLPWATPIQPVTSVNNSGIGFSPNGIVEGTWVVGFWADVNNYQIPMILGGISGLNKEPDSIEDRTEMYGTAFKDIRSNDTLKKHPRNKFSKREYPDGKSKSGDSHGAQIKNVDSAEKNPREMYQDGACSFPEGTPDTNVVAVNDPQRIDETIIKIKKDAFPGGLRETFVPVANVPTKQFFTGVINASGVNRGTNKGLASPPNRLKSSSWESLKTKYKSVVEKPTNVNKKTVYEKPKSIDSLGNIIDEKTVEGLDKLLSTSTLEEKVNFFRIDESIQNLTNKINASITKVKGTAETTLRDNLRG
jgi:hypothetical protein